MNDQYFAVALVITNVVFLTSLILLYKYWVLVINEMHTTPLTFLCFIYHFFLVYNTLLARNSSQLS